MITVADLIHYLQQWHPSTPVVLVDDGEIDGAVILEYALSELEPPRVADDDERSYGRRL